MGDALRHLLRRAADGKWNTSREELYVADKARGPGSGISSFKINHQVWHTELQDLMFVLLHFGLALIQPFLSMPQFLPFGVGMYIMCQCMLRLVLEK